MVLPLDSRRNDSVMDIHNILQAWDSDMNRNSRQSLDLLVLGVHCVSGLNKLELALVRYRQDRPDAPTCLELLLVMAEVIIA